MAYSSVYNFHAYDALGQLQTTAMYRGTPPASGAPASGDELPGRRFEYRYDNSGNRKSAGPTGNASGVDDVYTLKSNGLNQYVTKENNTVRILGTVNATSIVTAQGPAGAIAVTKRDRNFAGDLAPANTSGPAKGDVTITASSNDSPPVVDSDTRSWQIAPRNQSFDYDADGNLWKDNVWEYTYDAENRLIRMASLLPTGQGFKRLQLDFVYDNLGRRVQKTVKDLDTNTVTSARRYLYDGWNLVAELDAAGSAMQRSYTWGLDAAGSLSATAGIGALVRAHDHAGAGNDYYPSYDGNGNVSSLTRGDGTLVAIYEYSPFGELLRGERRDSNDAFVASNPWKFSTKFTDDETGLVYYGLRYYSPVLGRFINRDPIEERGGLNLYEFAGNAPVRQWDVLGLWLRQVCVLTEVWTIVGRQSWLESGIHCSWVDQGPLGPPAVSDKRPPTAGFTDTPNNDDGGTNTPTGANQAPKKKLPPCSELRKRVDAGKGPKLTVQSFIESATAWGFRGDNRGFTDSPADGVYNTYRTSASVRWPTEVTGDTGRTVLPGVYSGKAVPTVSGYVGIDMHTGPDGSTTYNRYRQDVMLYAAASDPFFQGLAPSASQDVRATMDFQTGNINGTVTRTDFPGVQIFVDGQPVYNYSANAAGKTPGNLYDKSTDTFSAQICDPTR